MSGRHRLGFGTMFARQGDIDFSVNGCHLFAKYTLLVKARFRHNFGWKCPNRFGNVLPDKKLLKLLFTFLLSLKRKAIKIQTFVVHFSFRKYDSHHHRCTNGTLEVILQEHSGALRGQKRHFQHFSSSWRRCELEKRLPPGCRLAQRPHVQGSTRGSCRSRWGRKI